MYYCVYHNIEHQDTVLSNDEHIIPLSLGGSNELVIKTCEKSNSELGSSIDAALNDNILMSAQRFRLGLTGHSGKLPSLDFSGTVNLGDSKHNGRFTVNSDSLDAGRISIHPMVEKTTNRTSIEYTIRCQPEDEDRILQDIERKERKRGNTHVILRSKQGESRVEPTLNTEQTIDVLALQKFFYKMALGFGYYIIGESFSRHPDADILRQFIWEPNRAKALALPRRGSVWPSQTDNFAKIIGTKDYHLLSLQNPGPLIFSALLFGTYGCTLALCDDGSSFQDVVPRNDGVAVWINPASRVMGRDSFTKYLMLVPQLREG